MRKHHLLKNRYKLLINLKENAGRQTWIATDVKASSPKTVMIKLLAFNPQMQWDELKLFEREAKIMQTINHPRIPQYIDYFTVDSTEGEGLLWLGLVQNYIKGDSLQDFLDKKRYFRRKEIYYITEEILEILIYLHELSPPIIHRDIKPSNLLLGEDDHIYLVDFGAVQDKAKAEGVTFTVVGTSGYVPPEQLWGKAVPASDLYALGATLIHLVTNIPPTELPQKGMQIQFKHQATRIHPSFANWIEKLIQPAAEKRFKTTRIALYALKNLSLDTKKFGQDIDSLESELRSSYVWGWLSLLVFIGSGLFLLLLV
ncbi:MAG: serine/threonine-protein kinase [Coleofasciculus sp. C1-SOL-03]|jgi:serine/threonine protein kinase|uniref:serine/threonine protein kinase n=1 Tax=Coleofasciculus sp. C1-SOL-03 TaxID=3069522 RepID=UPI0032F3812B